MTASEFQMLIKKFDELIFEVQKLNKDAKPTKVHCGACQQWTDMNVAHYCKYFEI